jgi:hypothetical protein
VYDASDIIVAKLLDHQVLEQGYQTVEFDASNISTGVYVFTLVAETLPQNGMNKRWYTMSRKMLLIK